MPTKLRRLGLGLGRSTGAPWASPPPPVDVMSWSTDVLPAEEGLRRYSLRLAGSRDELPWSKGTDDLEARALEDVVRPIDADVMDVVLAVAQLRDSVDYGPRVSGERSFGRFVRCCTADDRPRPRAPISRDLADLR